jgi:hypothetical protein
MNDDKKAMDKALQLPNEERQRLVTKISFAQGAYAALHTGAVWTPLWAALKYGTSPAFWFNRSLDTTGRTALLIWPPLFAFYLVSDQVAVRLGNHDAFHSAIHEHRATTLGPFERFANYALDNPFQLLVFASAPVVGLIGYNNSKKSALSVSQAVMDTRVIGQFSVLVILGSTMFFHDFMRSHGRFLEPWEVPEFKSQEWRRQQPPQPPPEQEQP